jgi:hypothetical protein
MNCVYSKSDLGELDTGPRLSEAWVAYSIGTVQCLEPIYALMSSSGY